MLIEQTSVYYVRTRRDGGPEELEGVGACPDQLDPCGGGRGLRLQVPKVVAAHLQVHVQEQTRSNHWPTNGNNMCMVTSSQFDWLMGLHNQSNCNDIAIHMLVSTIITI